MWDRQDLIEIMMKRGMDELAAAAKVDNCLSYVKQEPLLAAMYFHDMLKLDFGYIDVKEIEDGEAGYCKDSNEA